MAVSGSVPAAGQASDGKEVIHAVGLVDLQQFVSQRGDTVVDTGKTGRVSVLAKTRKGLTYALSGRACSQRGVTGCGDLFIEVRYVATPGVTDTTLARANAAVASLKVWQDGKKQIVGVSRYVVLRGGVTRQNVLDNVNLLVGLAPAAARIAFGKGSRPAAAK
jgi:hypothetical protein